MKSIIVTGGAGFIGSAFVHLVRSRGLARVVNLDLLTYAGNAVAPVVLVEEAKRLGGAIVHYSTDYVFDGAKGSPYTEADTPRPLGIYGETKLAGEVAVREAGLPHLILRTSWLYGSRGKNFG